jgi:hypothetical protein
MRCFVRGKFPLARKSTGCRDVNPRAFHIIIANKLGLSKASVDPEKEASLGTAKAKFYVRKYQYFLDLNSRGQILGGEWISKERPDFMWSKEKDKIKGHWSKLEKVYQANI